MLPTMPNGRELSATLRKGLEMKPEQFKARWSAD
jgi:hypothetical protein